MAEWILDISYFLQQKRGEYSAIYLDKERSSKDLLYGKNTFSFVQQNGQFSQGKRGLHCPLEKQPIRAENLLHLA